MSQFVDFVVVFKVFLLLLHMSRVISFLQELHTSFFDWQTPHNKAMSFSASRSSPSLGELLSDVLQLVFSYNPSSLLNYRLVCKRWDNIICRQHNFRYNSDKASNNAYFDERHSPHFSSHIVYRLCKNITPQNTARLSYYSTLPFFQVRISKLRLIRKYE